MNDYPVATVVDIPVTEKGVPFLPAIVLRDFGISKEFLAFIRDEAYVNSPSSLNSKARTIARFLNFWNLFVGERQLDIDEQTNTIFAYIDFRINGTHDLEDGHVLKPLDWSPVVRTTVRTEFSTIIDFLRHIEDIYDGEETITIINKVKLTLAGLRKDHYKRYMRIGDKDFFIHLRKSREFWSEVRGPKIQLPQWARPKTSNKKIRNHPTTDEVLELIAHETNPVYKAIFIALAFGSHRASEVLHAWQCDALPSFERERFFNTTGSNNDFLFLIAHPQDSTYTGDYNKKRQTREQYLKSKYSLHPRTKYGEKDTYHLGWKSKLLYGEHQTANTHWLHPEAAQMFADCIEEIMQFHLRNRTSKRHPYLFVNMYGKGDDFGAPMKLNRVQKAISNAYKRIDIEPYKYGRNLHGLRHWAKFYAETELGLTPSQIQIIRGDHSIASQEDYGRDATYLQKVMQDAAPQRLFKD